MGPNHAGRASGRPDGRSGVCVSRPTMRQTSREARQLTEPNLHDADPFLRRAPSLLVLQRINDEDQSVVRKNGARCSCCSCHTLTAYTQSGEQSVCIALTFHPLQQWICCHDSHLHTLLSAHIMKYISLQRLPTEKLVRICCSENGKLLFQNTTIELPQFSFQSPHKREMHFGTTLP